MDVQLSMNEDSTVDQSKVLQFIADHGYIAGLDNVSPAMSFSNKVYWNLWYGEFAYVSNTKYEKLYNLIYDEYYEKGKHDAFVNRLVK